MNRGRREFILAAGAAVVGTNGATETAGPQEEKKMYGLIARMTAVAGRRDALATILLDGTKDMPGCLSYVIAFDVSDANTIWITEVWDSKASHDASLSLPSVKQAIAKGRPMIAEFGDPVATAPVGGHGLSPATSR